MDGMCRKRRHRTSGGGLSWSRGSHLPSMWEGSPDPSCGLLLSASLRLGGRWEGERGTGLRGDRRAEGEAGVNLEGKEDTTRGVRTTLSLAYVRRCRETVY